MSPSKEPQKKMHLQNREKWIVSLVFPMISMQLNCRTLKKNVSTYVETCLCWKVLEELQGYDLNQSTVYK